MDINVTQLGIFEGTVQLAALALLFVTAAVHIAFAIGVFNDANTRNLKGTGPEFVAPVVWSLATLVGGVFVATAYWAIHMSTLSRLSHADPETETGAPLP